MRYCQIPGTDLNPAVICIGALPFGVSIDEQTSFALLDGYFAAGGNFLDTALVYGEWLPDGKGASERMVGRWLAARNNRQQVIVGTKGAHPRLDTMHLQRLAPADIQSDLNESLRNLGTDYIDLYWLHRDDPTRPVGEILTTLNELVALGKIRAFGCSNWRFSRIAAAQEYAAAHNLRPFCANQLMWSLAVPNSAALFDPVMVIMDDAGEAFHRQSGLPAMAYNSQAGGFFTKLQSTSLAHLPANQQALYGNDENTRRLARLQTVSRDLALPLSAVALAYITSHSFPSYALSGCSTPAQLAENLRAADLTLSPSTLAYLKHG